MMKDNIFSNKLSLHGWVMMFRYNENALLWWLNQNDDDG